MKKKMLFLIMVVCIVIGALPAATGTSIQVGDYIRMGTYYGEPILWRCVDIDENGPLILSDRIICIKPFDAIGANTAGLTAEVSRKRERHTDRITGEIAISVVG